MPSYEQFDSLRMRVETELSEQTTFSYCPEPQSERFAVNLKTGGTIIVCRCDMLNLMIISKAENMSGNKFEVSADPIPGKTEHEVKLAKAGVLDENGSYKFIKGEAAIRVTRDKHGNVEYTSVQHTFRLPDCRLTFDVIKHLARGT